jgi:flagellar biosynthesis chaperone FliJ
MTHQLTVCHNCERLERLVSQLRLKCEELEIDKVFLADRLEFADEQLRLISESRNAHEQLIVTRVQSFLSRPSHESMGLGVDGDNDSEASVVSIARYEDTQRQLRDKLEEVIVLKSELYDLKKALIRQAHSSDSDQTLIPLKSP